MAYDAENLRLAVRNYFQNMPETILRDDVLETFLEAGIRRLSTDRPHERNEQLEITGNNTCYYDCSALPGWVGKFSAIRGVAPYPDVATASGPSVCWMYQGTEWGVQEIAGTDYLVVAAGRTQYGMSDLGYLVKYTTPYTVDGVMGATVTNVPLPMINALELVCAIELARGRAANSAGKMDNAIPGDIINWANKQREYSNQAREWERRYWLILGFTISGGPPPVMTSMDFNFHERDGYVPLTHEV